MTAAVWITARCPACGWDGCLFVANGGYTTCSRIDCPDPEAGHAALENAPRPALVSGAP